MALFDMFKAPVQQPARQQQQNQNTGNSTGADNNQQNVQGPGTQQNNNQNGNPQNPANGTPPNPLDAYSKMWDTPDASKAEVAPTFALDDKVLDTVSSQQDFMKGINPDLVAKAQSGDAGAMMELMQAVGRNSYKAAISHSGMLTDKFVGAREGFNEKSFGKKVRGELTNQALADTPNFAHPVVRKQLTDVANRLQQQHPDAAPQEIAKMAKDYLTELAGALNPTEKVDPKAPKKGETNWDTFFDEPEQQ